MSDDNSSKQMFATGTQNNVSSGHMKAINFVLDNRRRREKVPDLFNGENVEWADYVWTSVNMEQMVRKQNSDRTRNEFIVFCFYVIWPVISWQIMNL